ncbi:transporter [Zhihengliuella sp.]|uniref:transporter n=1 Tax=Zhihengliuella sp. TaxID=1954483 RepID=UPI00281288A4|nr:transporter [Zhihengliuella sp.]
MVAELIRLKAALLVNGFRRSPWQLVGVVLGALYGLFITAMLIVGLFGLGGNDDRLLIGTVLILAGGLTTLLWAVIPVLAAGVDATLDPQRFASLPIPRRDLAAGLLLTGFVGVPGAVTVILFLAQTLAWRQWTTAAVVALPAGALGALYCLALARMTTTAAHALTASRRFREVGTILLFVPLVLLGPIIGGIESWISSEGSELMGWLPQVADIVAWTPLGAFAALPADAAAGAWAVLGIRLAVALAYLAATVGLWAVLLQRSLEQPASSGGGGRSHAGLGTLRWFPAAPWGAVAGRALTYWFKDPRYAASIVVVPLIPIAFWYASSQAGSPFMLYAAAPLVAVMLGFSISADVSYDSTAFALHVTTGLRGVHDRLGRVVACAAISVPLVVLLSFIPLAAGGDPVDALAILGVSLGGLLSGLGVSSVVSARWTYSVPLPGENPFKTPPGAGARVAIVQLGTFAVATLALLPELGLLIAYFVTGHPVYAWLTLLVGLVLGGVLLALGVRVGGRWFDARLPELMQAVTLNK